MNIEYICKEVNFDLVVYFHRLAMKRFTEKTIVVTGGQLLR